MCNKDKKQFRKTNIQKLVSNELYMWPIFRLELTELSEKRTGCERIAEVDQIGLSGW